MRLSRKEIVVIAVVFGHLVSPDIAILFSCFADMRLRDGKHTRDTLL